MNYNKFQSVSISALGMGAMRLPLEVPSNQRSPIDYPAAREILLGAHALGINYFDTAYVYGDGASERCLGRALKEVDRDSFFIADKYNVDANPDYEAVFAEQLERLQTDRIDFMLLHCFLEDNADKYLTNGSIDYFLRQKADGKIRYLGFSNHASCETLERVVKHHQWDFAQIQLNYYDWLYGSARREYEILRAANIPIAVMEPVRGGRLAELTPDAEVLLRAAHPEWSIASWAFRFIKRLPGVYTTLSGMSSKEQLEDNLRTYEDAEGLSADDTELLLKACALFKNRLQVPCTECRYCKDCPVDISIPEYLKLYNSYKVDGPWALNAAKRIESQGKPEDCVGCGACTAHCPQNINTPAIMQELAQLLKT